MNVRVGQPGDSSSGLMPLPDVTGLSLAELAASPSAALARSIRDRLTDLDDDRNPVFSAFDSFLSS